MVFKLLSTRILCKLVLLGALSIFSLPPAFAEERGQETVEFPDEELATESVLPVFDLNLSVRNRLVNLSKKFEFGLGFGYSMLEPFFAPMSIGGSLTYQWNEEMGLNLMFNYFLGGVSDYTNQLNPIPGTGINANIQYAPAPKYMAFLNYQYAAFYGKLSVSKEFVLRTSLFFLAGLGGITIGEQFNLAYNLGVGQRFFVSPKWSLRFDMRFYAYEGPDVLSRDLSGATAPQAASTFSKKLQFGSILGLVVAVLL